MINYSQSNEQKRISSTDQHETFSRQHILFHSDLPRYNQKHRSEVDSSERRSTPQSNSLFFIHTDNQQQHQEVLNFRQMHSKITQLQEELTNERKKNSKLKRIISSKIEKEKQLEEAYRGIAIELKKQMIANTPCFCKTKLMSEKNQHSIELEKPQALLSQIEILKKENSILKAQLQQTQIKYDNLVKQSKEISLREQAAVEIEHLRALNQLYASQIEKLRQEVIEVRCFSKQNFQISKQNKIDKQIQTNTEAQKGLERQSLQNSSQPQLSRQKHQVPTKPEHINLQLSRHIFKTFQQEQQPRGSSNKQSRTNQVLKPIMNPSDISKDKQSKQLQNCIQPIRTNSDKQREPRDSSISFQTVQEKSSFSQFYSICNSQELKNEQSNCPIPDFEDVSSVCISKLLQNSGIHDSEAQLKHFCEKQEMEQKPHEQIKPCKRISRLPSDELNVDNALETERDKMEEPSRVSILLNHQTMSKCIKTLRLFISTLNSRLNEFSQKVSWKLDFGDIYTMIDKVQSRKLINSQSNLSAWVMPERVEELADEVIVLFRKAQQSIRKQSQKQANNLCLQIAELNNKYITLKEEKQLISKKMETIIQYNKKLEYEIAQLSCSGASSPQQNQRNNLLHEIYRSKISMAQPIIDEAEVQCTIVSWQEHQKCHAFLKSIPKLITQVLMEKIGTTISADIYGLEDLQAQFKKIISNVISITQKSRDAGLSARKKSWSCSSMKQEKPRQQIAKEQCLQTPILAFPTFNNEESIKEEQQYHINPQSYFQMEAQNEQLQKDLKEKQEEISRLKQKIALQKYDIEKLQEILAKKLTEESQVNHYNFDLYKNGGQQQGNHRPRRNGSKQLSSRGQVDSEEQSEFLQNSSVKEFNNLKFQKDEEMKCLRQRVEALERQLQEFRLRAGERKGKVRYLNY